ncbi:MAG: hypothetical protein EPN67_05965 [Pusillimonas sp.]|nr:MAG: hypothetical protein EPN67_05965 [Pusillimonas sp.]
MRSNRIIRSTVLAQAVIIAFALCGNASAQQTIQPVVRGTSVPSAVLTVSIPAQSMESALDAFAVQSKLQLVYASKDAIAGLQSPGYAGTLPAYQVLQQLLGQSGLVFEFVNGKTVVVHRRSSAAGSSIHPASTAPVHQADASGLAAAPAAVAGANQSDKDVSALSTVNVTGTNLRDIDSASPLITIDADQIQNRGYSSIEDVLRHLPQNFASTSSTSVALGETEYGQQYGPQSTVGASSVNLRGLGSRSTLILVNGHRLAGSAQDQGGYTDISSIPVSQIERIEVLSDGASAIYGADAVAGVVNIVLKKDYSGTVLHVRHDYSNSGADETRLDVSHTFSWNKGFLTASANDRKTDPADSNRFISVGPAGRGDFSNRNGTNARTPNLGQPGVVFDSWDVGGYHLEGAPFGVIPGGQNGTALQPGALLPYSFASAPSDYPVGRIGPKVTSPSLRLNGAQTFGHDLKFTWGASYAEQKDSEYWHPAPWDLGFLEDGYGTYVPASNPYNHFGQDVMVGYSYAKELAGMTFSQQQKQTNINFNAGVSGKLPILDGWDFDVSYSGSRERGRANTLGDFIGSLGPDGYARTINVLDGLNVFGDGSDPQIVAANRALLDTLVQTYTNTFSSSENSVNLLTRGGLFAMPAGLAQAAIGAEYRTDGYRYQNQLVGNTSANSSRHATAIFAELGFPLLKNMPFAKELTLTLAARRESFTQHGSNQLEDNTYGANDLLTLGGFNLTSLVGAAPDASTMPGALTQVSRSYSSTSPEVKLTWVPVAELRVRATWGKSFLTPQMSSEFGLAQASDYTYGVVANGGTLPPGVTHVINLSGPNPNLKPQVATVKTFGFDYMPKFAEGLMVSATYNDTNFSNYIGAPLAGLSYAQIFSNLGQMPPGTFTQGKNGVLLWDNRNINFLGRRSRSVDTAISYYFENTLGSWRLEWNAVRTLELESRSVAQSPAVVFSDTEFGPSKWVADVSLNWQKNSYFATAGLHYISPFRVMQPLSATGTVYNDYTPNPNPRTLAPSYTTMDFQVGYCWQQKAGWLSGVTARLGVQDAFDRAFPFVDNSYGFVSTRADVRGRVIYLDLTKEF